MIGHGTLFRSEKPAHLGKVYTLGKDGTLQKTVAGNMSEGTVALVSFSTADDLPPFWPVWAPTKP